MAFAFTVTGSGVVGNKKRVYGTFTNTDTDSGGDITTGLSNIETADVQITSHVDSSVPKLFFNSTNAGVSTAGTLGVICPNNVDGNWEAVGI